MLIERSDLRNLFVDLKMLRTQMFKTCIYQLYQKVSPRKFSNAMTQWLAFSALLQPMDCDFSVHGKS